MIYETCATHENEKRVDQTDAQNGDDLFSMHLLRRRGLIGREITTISSVDSDPYPRQRGRRRPAAMELCLFKLRRGTRGKN